MRDFNKLGFALGLWLFAVPAFATDLAILHNGFSVRHERRENLGAVTRLYLGADKSSYVDIATDQIERFEREVMPPIAIAPPPKPKPQNLSEVINTISDRHHLDPDLINSVIHAESGFNPRAVSPKGAQGLMQLMPQTASKLGVSNPFDANANVEGGTRYLSELLERYNFDLIKALAAYNAGPGRVERYRGVPPYYETREYVAKIVRDFNRKKLAQRKAAAGATARAMGSKKTNQPPALVKQAVIPNVASQPVR
ncbi:MAG TPA: lytic transglycosylase domain-containing protein [Terriglobales bacterium]|nr:lytic transglycosylase domain-containing protein [Terriglobales bacterium]